MSNQEQIEALFNEALDLQGEARDAFYRELAGTDQALCQRLRAMVDDFEGMAPKLSQGVMPLGALAHLAGHAGSDSFLETVDGSNRLNPVPVETMPEQIGPYKVLGKIGEGGMGLVYLVEQQEPKRQLALKLLSQARMTTEMKARFQAEYQTQAIMRHPNIAGMHESGVSEHGEIFFTMEYVKGWTITEYCREKRLDLEDRLRLFMQICDGITHAHQKSVMHRDLKPTNILVTEESGTALVKIIDFGIAKIMEDTNEREFETRVGTLVGTLEYMSSEQLSGSGDVDTRSDVFSLGVVLYEMLCGTLPRRYRRRGNSSAEEVLRYYREAEAVRPGVLLDEMEDPRQHLLSAGYENPQAVRSALKDELDWVPLKAMALDPSRRYQSPSALKADLQRFLDFEPVQARPPGLLYRSRKFLRRNLFPVTLVSVILLALFGGMALLVQSNRALSQAKAETEKNLRRYKATNDFLQEMLSAPDPRNRGVEARVVEVLRASQKRLNEMDDGTDSSRELEASIRVTLGKTLGKLGSWNSSIAQFKRVAELQQGLLGDAHPDTLKARHDYYQAKVTALKYQEARPELEGLLADQTTLLGDSHPQVLDTLTSLARVYFVLGESRKALSIASEALSLSEQIHGLDDCGQIELYSALAYSYLFSEDFSPAIAFARAAMVLTESCFGADNYETLNQTMRFHAILINTFPTEKHLSNMLRLERQMRELSGRINAKSLGFLGMVYLNLDDYDQAIELGETVVSSPIGYQELNRVLLGAAHNICNPGDGDLFLEDFWAGFDENQLEFYESWMWLGKTVAFSELEFSGWEVLVYSILNDSDIQSDAPTGEYLLLANNVATAHVQRGRMEKGRDLICKTYSSVADPSLKSKFLLHLGRNLYRIGEREWLREVLEDVALDGVFPHRNEAQYLLYSEFGVAYEP